MERMAIAIFSIPLIVQLTLGVASAIHPLIVHNYLFGMLLYVTFSVGWVSAIFGIIAVVQARKVMRAKKSVLLRCALILFILQFVVGFWLILGVMTL